MQAAITQPVQHIGEQRRWAVLAVLCLSLLMVVMDNTILNVALPSLSTDLEASSSELTWIVDAYSLLFAGLLLTFGALGDRFGRQGALNLGLVIFGLASAASIFATAPEHLIATRALMGTSAALIMPATLSILTNVFTDRAERAQAIAIWSAVAGAGLAIGPITGGWLLDNFEWNAIFILNLPVVAIALAAGHAFVPTSRDPARPAVDVLGAVLSTVGMVSLVYGIIEAPESGWTSPVVLASFSTAAISLLAFALHELRTCEPMLNLEFFKNPRFTAGSGVIAIGFMGMFGAFFLLTQYLQFIRGYSPLEAGFALLPMAGGILVAAPLGERLTRSLGSKTIVTAGMLTAAVGLLMLSTAEATTPYAFVGLALGLAGFGLGLTFPSTTEAVMGSVPASKAGVASAMNDTARELGGAFGVALLSTIFSSTFRSSVEGDLAANGVNGPQAVQASDSVGGALAVANNVGGSTGLSLVDATNGAFADGFGLALLVAAAASLVAAIVALVWLPARELTAEEADDSDTVALPEPQVGAPALVPAPAPVLTQRSWLLRLRPEGCR